MEHIISCMIKNAGKWPDKTAYSFLSDDGDITVSITYRELLQKIRKMAGYLSSRNLKEQRVLLIYKDSLQFILSFLACSYAGVIPVPVYYPQSKRQFEKIGGIIRDADAAAILSAAGGNTAFLDGMLKDYELSGIVHIDTGGILEEQDVLPLAEPVESDIAFIQYTSGTTESPKGVVVAASGLVHNQGLIQHTFGCTPDSRILSWLPFQHDMGLIGNILHTVYVGCTCYILSPLQFMQQPYRWLKAISRYKITHSGGPDFAYNLCLKITQADINRLDLSSWQVAYNGAEPVRAATLRNFSEQFEAAGFRAATFCPCYGLAEATLLVAGVGPGSVPLSICIDRQALAAGNVVLVPEIHPDARQVASSGPVVPGMELIITTDTGKVLEQEGRPGEICIAGQSVTGGYWNRDNQEIFYTVNGKKFLRTGDVGYLYRNELFVHSRLKEMLIIRGKNFYLNDIEEIVRQSDMAAEISAVAAFGNLLETEEQLVIVVELKREFISQGRLDDRISAVNQMINAMLAIVPFDIVMTSPLAIPRTTSGKIQRRKCLTLYQSGSLPVLQSKRSLKYTSPEESGKEVLLSKVLMEGNYQQIRAYLVALIGRVAEVKSDLPINDNVSFTDLGIDSIGSVTLINTINKDLDINLDLSGAFQYDTLSGMIGVIENLLWLKSGQTLTNGISI